MKEYEIKEYAVDEIFDYKGQSLKVLEDKFLTMCSICYFYEDCNEDSVSYCCEASERKDGTSVFYIKKPAPHFYGDFTAYQKVKSFIEGEIETIEKDLPEMEESVKKKATKALLEQYRIILENLEVV